MAKRRLAKTPSGKEKRKAKSRWTTWAVLGGLAVAIGVVIAVVVIQREGPPRKEAAHVGSPAPDFTLRLFNGESITLSSLKGKPVLLNFWASG
jgi:cytochrome c biogenesis protein CcmG, thiol:disulfide interchange protein DsbE